MLPPLFLKIREVDISGNNINVHTISGSTSDASQLVTADLSLISFNPNTHFLDITMQDSSPSIVSENLRLLIEPRPCTTYTPYKLIYLDSKGSYVSINFDGVSTRQERTKSKTFRKFIDPLTETETSRGVQRFFQDTEVKNNIK